MKILKKGGESINEKPAKNHKIISSRVLGFSLLEVLCVTAIISILVALAGPSLSGFTSPLGRKGAVTIVMNTLEQARVSAIETGEEVVVLFWKKNGTLATNPDEQDSMVILRKNDTTSTWVQPTRREHTRFPAYPQANTVATRDPSIHDVGRSQSSLQHHRPSYGLD